jgi:hypothetical protein
MAQPMEHEPVGIEPMRTRRIEGTSIEVIDDEFSRLPPEEQAQLTRAWIDGLRSREPIDIGVSAAEALAEARHEMGWQ